MIVETLEQFRELQRECVKQVKFYVGLAAKKVGVHIPMPLVNFQLSGGVAGRAYYRHNQQHEIRFNPKLLRENADTFIEQTVGHEVAHLAAFTKYSTGIKPHGPEWARTMWAFSLPATRCHSYEVSRQPVRNAPEPVRKENGLIIKPVGCGKIIEFD